MSAEVVVLAGGDSPEREFSLSSGKAVVTALTQAGYAVTQVDTAAASWWQLLCDRRPKAVFIALHGAGGEDGQVQAVLEMLQIPYTGSGVLASALAFDKLRCKYLLRGIGLATPEFVVLKEPRDAVELLDRYGCCAVKPSCSGSSLGVSRVTKIGELAAAHQSAANYPGGILAERWIDGDEFAVALLEGHSLPAVRIESEREFYDFEAKYRDRDTRCHCPCGLDAREELQLQSLARAAFDAVGGRGWGRADIIRDSGGNCFLLELNTVPGLTARSLVPKAAAAEGIDFMPLTELILETAQ